MNKAFYIISLVLSFVFICVSGFYIGEVESARALDYLSSYSSYSDPYSSYSYSMGSGMAEEATSEAALISIFFFLFFITTDLLGVIKLKSKTIKALGIVGLSLSGIMFIWNFLVLSTPSSVSFDEVGPVYVLYGLVILAFSIVGLIQAIRIGNNTGGGTTSSDILDA